MEKLRLGDVDRAIESARTVTTEVRETGAAIWDGLSMSVLVEALLQRCGEADLEEAHVAIDRLAGLPIDPGLVLHETCLLRLRALLARAHGDETGYRRPRLGRFDSLKPRNGGGFQRQGCPDRRNQHLLGDQQPPRHQPVVLRPCGVDRHSG
jgi:adenylate cyclase